MSKKKILLINRELLPYSESSIGGGAEFVVFQRLKLLHEKYEVHFYCSSDSEKTENCSKQIFSSNPSKYFYKKQGIRAPGRYMKIFISEINNLVENFDYDIIMSHCYDTYGFRSMLNHAKDRLCIHFEHGSKESRGGISQIMHYNKTEDFFNENGILVADSDFAMNDLNDYVEKKWLHPRMYNSYMYPFFFNEEWKMSNTINDYLITVTRIDAVKSPHITLEIMKNLPDIKLKLYGNYWEGNEDYKLYHDKLIEKYSQYPNIEFHINKSRTEVLDALSKARAFILSSYNECFSVACAEALNFGIPMICVAQKHGKHGYDLIYEDYNGYVKKVVKDLNRKENLNKLTQSVLDIYSMPYNKQIKNEIVNIASKHFSTQNFYDQIEQLYKEFKCHH